MMSETVDELRQTLERSETVTLDVDGFGTGEFKVETVVPAEKYDEWGGTFAQVLYVQGEGELETPDRNRFDLRIGEDGQLLASWYSLKGIQPAELVSG